MKKRMIQLVTLVILIFIAWQAVLLWQAAGRMPRGERLERCQRSPQWKDGAFANVHDTPTLTSDKGVLQSLWEYLFAKRPNLTPSNAVPVVKSNLRGLPREAEVCVWLGHSSVFIQTGGVRFLFDPVLTNQLPVWWFMRPFKGTMAYSPDDIPDIDYLVITHDHWDHLDWRTVKALKDRTGQVVCALGIGEHFEYWGYAPDKVHELDWHGTVEINDSLTLRALPTRHFSGRLFGRGKTLWASYMIEGKRTIFVSGDGGYDERFKEIGRQYPDIDLAIMENGQYDEGWHYIHTMPDELPQAINDLSPRRVMTYHHSKYALANHAWTAPLDSIWQHAQGQSWTLLTPRIGEVIDLNVETTFDKWW